MCLINPLISKQKTRKKYQVNPEKTALQTDKWIDEQTNY